MNPVDRELHIARPSSFVCSLFQIPTEVVTINTLVTLLPWPETHLPVKRLVLSPPGEPVCSGVPSTSLPPTNKRFDSLEDGGGVERMLAPEVWIIRRICTTYASVFTANITGQETGEAAL